MNRECNNRVRNGQYRVWGVPKNIYNLGMIFSAFCLDTMLPKGCVATYGQVAEMAGDRKMARAVGNALHKNPDPENIPCYRVVNSKGELAGAFAFGGANVQADRLRADGIEVENDRVDLKKYGMKN